MSPPRKKTMFNEATDQQLADIVTFSSIEGAKAAASQLQRMFNAAHECSQKLHIYRAVIQAANRAVAGTKRKKRPVGAEARAKWLAVSKVYRTLQYAMEDAYEPCKAERLARSRKRTKSCGV